MSRDGRILEVGRTALVITAAAFFALPLLALVLRTPWADLGAILLGSATADALWLSIRCSLAATVVTLALGLPLAAWLAGPATAARQLVRVLVTLPMVLPPVVSGVALLLVFGRKGLLGAWLHEQFGLSLTFSSTAVVIAGAYVAMPFFVLTTEAGFRALDRRRQEAAATLGAGPWLIFRSVTLPALAPSLRAAVLVSWARALGEFGATITFAGNLAGSTRTMPLAVYVAMETGPEAAIALSLVLVVVSAGILVAMRKSWFPGR